MRSSVEDISAIPFLTNSSEVEASQPTDICVNRRRIGVDFCDAFLKDIYPETMQTALPTSPGDPLAEPLRSNRDGSPRQEPIAVVGMACRFPGSTGLSDFWRQLIAGENAVVEGPPGSVIGRFGQLYPESNATNDALRFGAFIEDLDQFDAEFFRISPIEAQMLDPQQRIMLETSWQALEDAAIDPASLKGSRTGVYVGISNNDYWDMVIDTPETAESTGGFYAVTGTALNTAIGRVSFALGLEGPSMAIDTACSSSLVAIHQAVGGLQRFEADLALAGGVHICLAGRRLELRANAGMLSPEGQCKAFDATADGFVCGEGCGLVLLKRLSEAEADGDRIWAVIHGSSVNQDGASPGLTVPSGPAQQRAMEEALAQAGVSSFEADYLEAHGTGTIVGDPIELNAAAAVYGRGRGADNPLLIGSVKTNIGHLGPAAGVAGLIKTVLAMRHRVIPRHLNFKNPNPALDWEQLPVRVTDVMMDWPLHPDRLPLAGVNSFGWSGTNAHIVVGGYGAPATDGVRAKFSCPTGTAVAATGALQPSEPAAARKARFLPLSGKSRHALRDSALRHLRWLDERAEELSHESTAASPVLSDMAWTAAVGRSHFPNRAGIVFSNAAQLRQGLEGLAQGEESESSPALQQATKVAFLFTGQASQWVGMGKTLYDTEPVFRSVLDRCDRVLCEERGGSLLDVMFGRGPTDGLLDEPAWTQPAIYSLECALAALWASLGIRPSAVLGHSLGEIAAAQVAGVFAIEEGLRYAAARGALMGATRRDGAMAAVFAPADRVGSVVAEHNETSEDADLSVAADNGMQQVVSGPVEDLEAVLGRLEAEDVKVVRLRRSPAYHSALVDPALDDLEAAAADILGDPLTPSVPLVSNLTGQLLGQDEPMDAVYWRRQSREPVAFRDCVETLAEMGVDAVVEIGPQAVLGPLVSMIWPAAAACGAPVVLQSLQRPPRHPETSIVDTSGGFVTAVAGAYETGLDMQFAGLFAEEARSRISLPDYPFQRIHHWVPVSKLRRQNTGHPLLGTRHESPRGEVAFDTELLPSDPAWIQDHLVYGRVVAAGGLYGAMAVCASLLERSPAERNSPVAVKDMQMHSALIFDEENPDDGAGSAIRKLQFVLDAPSDAATRPFEIFSRGESEQGWALHAQGQLSSESPAVEEFDSLDFDDLTAEMAQQDTEEFYRMRSAKEIYLGPSYHTLKGVWAREGEAVAELVLQDSVDANGMVMHPLLLDGCFQVLSLARYLTGTEHGAVYMPFGWERLWVAGPMPERVIGHATVRDPVRVSDSDDAATGPPEVVTGDVRLYAPDGTPIGGLDGFTVKRATRSALLSAKEGLKDLLYEVAWHEQPLTEAARSAEFLACPSAVAKQVRPFSGYLSDEGVETPDWVVLLDDLERLSQAYALSALEKLGWERVRGAAVSPTELSGRLQIIDDHQRLFGRILSMLAEAQVLTRSNDGFVVAVGAGDPLPQESLANPGSLADRIRDEHPEGANELGLLRRCGAALAEVLQGRADPLPLLFSDEGPSATDLYLEAPASRAANRMLAEVVAATAAGLPEDRRLRVLEVGAGTGAATASILPTLPVDRFDYTFTDISAGFFTGAESRLPPQAHPLTFKSLDIEAEPSTQGFDSHCYDLVIAANVLHATRDLSETLAHCRDLLAPSGQLIALEGLKRRARQDLTFGLLDGWWRFADAYRPDHALATSGVWCEALTDAGFSDIEFLGSGDRDTDEPLGSSVLIARGPEEVAPPGGIWILAADEGGSAAALAAELAARGQTVVVAGAHTGPTGALGEDPDLVAAELDPTQRESWCNLFEGLRTDLPLKGIVNLIALDGHRSEASTQEMAEDVTRIGSSALALVQGIIDAGATPTEGVWFTTRGAQVLKQDFVTSTPGELAGATLWGFGKVIAAEESHLQPRLLDLDPGLNETSAASLADEILYCDPETHIAHRGNSRYAARLARVGIDSDRLVLPESTEWVIGPQEPELGLEALRAKPQVSRALDPGEVRIATEAMGLNFADVLLSIGAVPYDLEIGREICGRVLEVATDVEGLAVGDLVVGIGFGGFAPETITQAVMVAPVPHGLPATALATMPTCFVTAELAFELAGLTAGERVLIHAGAGGVGLAAIQLAQAAGAEIFATASASKQSYLRSLGVDHVYDSRQTTFGSEILDATAGEGVAVVLNSLTGEGFIEASLSCVGVDGRFVEIGKRDIWSEEDISASRPDVAYSILDVDTLKRTDPTTPGAALKRVMRRLAAEEIAPLPHTVWPLAEIRSAMDVMRSASHIGKNVLRMPPLATQGLRPNRTYLVTGGMGGIGCEVARWLADNGAGSIVLNGRRAPDPAAEDMIRELREGGADVHVEVADVTDSTALDDMLARIDEMLPPLGGVIHSVGVLSDGVIENQTWDRFEQVLWPKVLGAWHLHQATKHKELDMFILFSSVAGVMGTLGQANHAAANAFLDQLASHRRAIGLPAQAIAWGAWSGIGEAEEHRERIEKATGTLRRKWITPEQGMQALDWLVRQDVTAPAVTTVDWSVVASELETQPRFLEDLLVATKDRDLAAEQSAPLGGLWTQLRDAPAQERQNLLTAFIQQELKAVMRLTSPPSPTVSFFDLGMDSLMAVELRNRINRAFVGERTASNTVVFDYPNATSLAGHLSREIEAPTGSTSTVEPIPRPARPRISQLDEPVAIVGMACRFPGAPDIESFWQQLEEGRSAVTDGRLDSGSWNGVLGDSAIEEPTLRWGAFVEGIDLFDSRFFRIMPIEARAMDPQQRMLLETSWQALEDAGINPDRLKGSRTGVYAGVGDSEYRDLIASRGQHYSYAGTSEAMTVGRVAFALGLEGPAMPLDMACASSLVAVHQAAAGLRRYEVDMALAGGVNAILSPRSSEFLRDMGMLSASGRCSAFDAAADGFVRGEGCGILVLKRLSEAEADGDRIWGVVLGSAVNQNGESASLMAPNGPAQERVMQDALAQADVSPSDVDYLEAHGIGSEFGDPIEMNALAAVYGRDRDAERPLFVGSVKTNIGHLEWASGIASLMKAALAMRRRVIPPHLHFNDPNPILEWDRLPVQIPATTTGWPSSSNRAPLAAVNSFAISGTNAHVVLGGYEDPLADNGSSWPIGPPQSVKTSLVQPDSFTAPGEFKDRTTRILPLSGKSPAALRDLARRYLEFLDDPGAVPSISDVVWTAGVGRSHFPYRAGLTFSDVAQLRERLVELAESKEESDDRMPPETTRPTFMYTGASGQWLGTGQFLHETEPVVREILDRCNEVLLAEQGVSLPDVMTHSDGEDKYLGNPATWAAVYTLECALTALWKDLGIRPTAIVGQGLGKIAAAQAAGVLSLEEGLRLAVAQGELSAVPVGTGEDPMPDGLGEALMRLKLLPPSVTMVSAETGQVAQPGRDLNASYWGLGAKDPVGSHDVVESLVELSVDALIEMGPGSSLGTSIHEHWPTSEPIEIHSHPPLVLPNLPGSSDVLRPIPGGGFVDAVAKAYESGIDIDFAGLFAGEARRRVPVPRYPFQRRRHWVDAPKT